MKAAFILILIFIFHPLCFSQKSPKPPSKAEIMREQIHILKNGVLLFELSKKENTIKAMIDAGKQKEAQRTRSETETYNEEIVSAFKKYFTFCPVYFFYSEDADKVLDKKLNEIVFLDE